MEITHKSQIKPFGNRFYRIKIINPDSNEFVIQNARTGKQTASFRHNGIVEINNSGKDIPSYFAAYESLLRAFKDSHKLFNSICEKELR